MADDMRTLGYICPKCGAQGLGLPGLCHDGLGRGE